jgi:hypothetical protein
MKRIFLLFVILLIGCQEIDENILIPEMLKGGHFSWETCFNSDDGVLGTLNQGGFKKSYELHNVCGNQWTGEHTVLKFECDNNDAKIKKLFCIGGCEDASCIASCVDSDGMDFASSGKTIGTFDGQLGQHKDVCSDADTLVEFYCEDNQVRYLREACSCFEGKCLTDAVPAEFEVVGQLPEAPQWTFAESADFVVIPPITSNVKKVRFTFFVEGMDIENVQVAINDSSYKLFDDGFHYDGLANDGIFAADVKNIPTGIYEVFPTYTQDDITVQRVDLLQRLEIINQLDGCLKLSTGERGKINVVVAAVGYANSTEVIHNVIDYKGNIGGLFSTSPFKSNREYFNVWQATAQAEGTLLEQGFKSLTACNKLNQYNLILYNGTLSLSQGPEAFGAARFGYTYHAPPLADGKLTAIHEFVHAFAGLEDEYDGNEFGPSRFPEQCYFSPYVDCEFTSGKVISCSGNAYSYSDCINNAPWARNIGDGCGLDGVIDCSGIGSLEVGCFLGCGEKKNLYRSTFSSGLRNPKGPFQLGLTNEKIVCEVIESIVGITSGCEKYRKI